MEALQDMGAGLLRQSVFIGLFIAVSIFLIHAVIRRRRAQRLYSPLTEDLLRAPGLSLERQLSDLSDKTLFGILLIVLLPAFAWIREFGFAGWVIVSIVVLAGIVYTSRVLSETIQLRLAADGEEYTGQELNLLMRSGAWVFHDIPYPFGNIDHIVVSTGGVFAVETKTFRKPEGDRQSQRLAKVKFDGRRLQFPHFSSSEPIEQAQRHAKHLRQSIKKNTGLAVAVTPVVALPGWYIERTARSDTWVIHPKRGGPLNQEVRKSVLSPTDAERIASYIESVVRSVPAPSKKMDP
jgi:hypothetical protein